MRKRIFSEAIESENVESESIAITPINLLFKFEGDPEKFPRRVIGTWWKRCIPTDMPQIGWEIDHADRVWLLTRIGQELQSKGSPKGDRLPVRICTYIRDL